MWLYRPESAGITVLHLADGIFEIEGRQARRAVALSDMTDPAALAWAQRQLEKLGVSRALGRSGARSGDLVRIGDFAFTYEPDHVSPPAVHEFWVIEAAARQD